MVPHICVAQGAKAAADRASLALGTPPISMVAERWSVTAAPCFTSEKPAARSAYREGQRWRKAASQGT